MHTAKRQRRQSQADRTMWQTWLPIHGPRNLQAHDFLIREFGHASAKTPVCAKEQKFIRIHDMFSDTVSIV
jgi:hypothetical protein